MNAPTPPCTWLVQSTVRGDTLRRLEQACAANGNPFHRIDVVPFSTELPETMPTINGPFFLYGYTTLLLNAARHPHWRRGIFFDPAVFRPSIYCDRWGADRMLNGDAQLLTMREFADFAETTPATRWFVKPDDDLKRFTGGVMTHVEYRDWYANIERLEGDGDIRPETQILVGEPKNFGHEWRLFVVDGCIAARSCYTNGGHDLPLPAEMERWALNVIADWSPADAFALDITRDADGRPKIIEANCINGSGLYLADAPTLVRALSAYQEAVW